MSSICEPSDMLAVTLAIAFLSIAVIGLYQQEKNK